MSPKATSSRIIKRNNTVVQAQAHSTTRAATEGNNNLEDKT